MKFYVKKIWSLNPTKYKYVEFSKAHKEYTSWFAYVALKRPEYKYVEPIKTFEEWLKTEI